MCNGCSPVSIRNCGRCSGDRRTLRCTPSRIACSRYCCQPGRSRWTTSSQPLDGQVWADPRKRQTSGESILFTCLLSQLLTSSLFYTLLYRFTSKAVSKAGGRVFDITVDVVDPLAASQIECLNRMSTLERRMDSSFEQVVQCPCMDHVRCHPPDNVLFCHCFPYAADSRTSGLSCHLFAAQRSRGGGVT